MRNAFEESIVDSRKVLDFHTHPYTARAEYMGMYGEDFYLEPEQMPEDLANAGISVFCGSVIDSDHRGPVAGFDEIRRVNDSALKLWKKFGDAYVPGFHVHPAFLRESLEEVERMHKAGVKLVGELVPYLQGWDHTGHDYGSKEFTEILALAGEYGMVVSYHTMPEWAPQMEKMVSSNPGVTFVAAHPGQKADYLLHVERMKKYPNLYLDISGTGLFRYGLLASAVKTVGAGRILFGTDYPICNPRMYVQAVLGEHISQEEKEDILFSNAQRILGI